MSENVKDPTCRGCMFPGRFPHKPDHQPPVPAPSALEALLARAEHLPPPLPLTAGEVALLSVEVSERDRSEADGWPDAPTGCVVVPGAEVTLDEALAALADIVTKATDYGEQDGGFVAFYLLPTGPIHRAIPLLARRGIHVRPAMERRADHDR